MTETSGPAWRQTIFWPFAHFSNLGRGRVLRARIDSPAYAATYYDPRGAQDLHFPLPEVPYLKLAAVHDERAGLLTLFALNRSLTDTMPLRVKVEGFREIAIDGGLQLRDADLKAANTRAQPDRVKPSALTGMRVEGTDLSATLPPVSWNVVRVKVRPIDSSV
jgi:alpha-N-arabinofuranosidase